MTPLLDLINTASKNKTKEENLMDEDHSKRRRLLDLSKSEIVRDKKQLPDYIRKRDLKSAHKS